jgi:hypothetical protein
LDRVKGEKPGELPVELPTKYELVFNLATAKAFKFDIPAKLLARPASSPIRSIMLRLDSRLGAHGARGRKIW